MLEQQLLALQKQLHSSRQSSPVLFGTHSPTLAPTLFKSESQEQPSLEHIPQAPALDHDSSTFYTPSTLNETVATPPELTQHPAAVLCDLQCHSGITSLAISTAWLSQILLLQLSVLSLTMNFVISSSLTTTLQKILSSLKSGLPMELSSPMETSLVLTLTTCLISKPTTTSPPLTARSAFRSRLLRRLLACTPALARPLLDATSLALLLASNNGLESAEASITSQGQGGQFPWEALTKMKRVIEHQDTEDHHGRTDRDPVDDLRRLRLLFDKQSGTKNSLNVDSVFEKDVLWKELAFR